MNPNEVYIIPQEFYSDQYNVFGHSPGGTSHEADVAIVLWFLVYLWLVMLLAALVLSGRIGFWYNRTSESGWLDIDDYISTIQTSRMSLTSRSDRCAQQPLPCETSCNDFTIGLAARPGFNVTEAVSPVLTLKSTSWSYVPGSYTIQAF
jgi:hypothetical protein